MRRFAKASAILACTVYASIHSASISSTSDMKAINNVEIVDLPKLPYAYDALEPFIDEKTVRIHHDKHHAKYVSNVKDLIANTPLQSESNMINLVHAANANKNTALFNNAAQSYNHAFYWECMKANGGGKPSAEFKKLNNLIEKSFGTFENFKTKFVEASTTVFGSGWVWLVYNKQTSLLEVC